MRPVQRLLALVVLVGGCSDPAPAPVPTSSGRPATEAVRPALGRTFPCFLASAPDTWFWGQPPAGTGLNW